MCERNLFVYSLILSVFTDLVLIKAHTENKQNTSGLTEVKMLLCPIVDTLRNIGHLFV